jgi:hypothetical protein
MAISNADIIDLGQLFQRTFGNKPYAINRGGELTQATEGEPYRVEAARVKAEQEFTAKGSLIKEQLNGVNIMLPVRFFDGPALLMFLPYVVISMRYKNVIIKTALAERKGTVKEQFNIDDYAFTIKGFLIDTEGRKFPEAQLEQLREMAEKKTAIQIDNALTNIFLSDNQLQPDEQRRVVIEDFELHDVQGGREHVRPFTMQLISDSIFTLEFDS